MNEAVTRAVHVVTAYETSDIEQKSPADNRNDNVIGDGKTLWKNDICKTVKQVNEEKRSHLLIRMTYTKSQNVP